jgi:hypothetical protein
VSAKPHRQESTVGNIGGAALYKARGLAELVAIMLVWAEFLQARRWAPDLCKTRARGIRSFQPATYDIGTKG